MAPPPALPHAPVDVVTSFAPRPPSPPSVAPGYPQLGGTEPGSLVAATEFTSIDPNIVATGATAWRIRYVSTSAVADAPVEVTGVVLVPGGEAPYDGWQVVAYNHPNTGILPGCGPSESEDLANQWGPVTALLQRRFAVVMTDYEGLGGAGRHAFLDSAALGRNVIDAVRAARHLRPDIGVRWAAFGTALGGLASWAANEQASSYGSDTVLVGAVARVPWVNPAGLAVKAGNGDLTPEQRAVYFQAIMAAQATNPDFDPTRFIRGATFDRRDELLSCKAAPATEEIEPMALLDPADLALDAGAQWEMANLMNQVSVPQQPTIAPMLVIYSATDPIIEQDWVETAIDRGCDMGDTIEWTLRRPGIDDDDMNAIGVLPWMRARFDDVSPVNLCPPDPNRP